MTPKLFNKNNRPTPYALHCGYIELEEFKTYRDGEVKQIRLTMWHEGGPCYHVRAYDLIRGIRLFLETFTRLTDARRCFDGNKKRFAKEFNYSL